MLNDKREEMSFSQEQEELLLLMLEEEGIDVQLQQTIPAGKGKGTPPLSFAQQRLWFLDQLEPNLSLYNMPIAIRLTGTLNAPILGKAVREIERRHEILRTTFKMIDEKVVQVLRPLPTTGIPLIDLEWLPASERDSQASVYANGEFQHPFDLATGPLLRMTLLRLREDEHVLLVTFHHAISDAWSHGIFLSELTTLYAAFLRGEPSPLPDLSIQYTDYAVWQREWLQKEVIDKDLSYWKEQLAGSPATLELPLDYPRPQLQSFRGGSQSLELPPQVIANLRQLGQREDATLFMLLLASFQILLARYSNQTDIVVGAAIANRTLPELENLIGFFANTLVLRTDISGNASYREIIQRVRKVALGAYEHQDMPFEQIVEALQPERDLGRNPIFQVMFVLQNVPVSTSNFSALTWQPLSVDNQTAKFDLTLMLIETEQGLVGTLEYNQDLFAASTTARMLTHFKMLLEGLVTHPDAPVLSVPMLQSSERKQLLLTWNATTLTYPREEMLAHCFELQVEQHPEAIALVSVEHQISYAELNRRANLVAHRLRDSGVGPEVAVGLYLERSLDLVIGLLAIAKAGGLYVPLDPQLPQERLRWQMQDVQVRLLLTQDEFLEQAQQAVASGITDVDTIAPVSIQKLADLIGAGEPARQENLEQVGNALNLAYVMYTSGSTGVPKGVGVPQRAVTRLVYQNEFAQLGPQEIVLQLAPVAFDASTLELWGSLLTGARLILYPGQTPSLETLGQVLKETGVSLLWLTAGLFHQIVNEQPQVLADVRQVLAGGDVLGVEQVRVLLRAHAGQVVINGYGPTENTTFTTCYPMHDVAQVERTVPIGHAIKNTTVYVLDQQWQPVPVGVVGELYTGGDGLARGYIGQPALTAECFVPDLFGAQSGGRLYRTGDLVRYRADGQLEFVGRVDQQVKVRGYRIELGEIEHALEQHEQVREAVVLAREDTPGSKRLVAYIIRTEHEDFSWENVHARLQEQLPDYMVPALHVEMERFPLTSNGKIDRRALPAPDYNHLVDAHSYEAAHTEVEQQLIEIWQQILGIQRIGIQDNFFALGGDSILSIQLVSRARRHGLLFTPKQLFQQQTIAKLTSVLSIAHSQSQGAKEQGVVTGEVPLTPIQHWFFEQDQPDPEHWNQAMYLKTAPDLKRQYLKQALNALVQHHDGLRLRFQRTSDVWRQHYASEVSSAPLLWLDLSSFSAPQRSQVMESVVNQAQASLDLTQGPLLRIVYMHPGDEQEGRLFFVIHHLAVDGVSWRILLDDLQSAYEQIAEGGSIQLPAKTSSWQQWSRRLHDYAQSAEIDEDLTYWYEQAQLSATSLPVAQAEGDNTLAAMRSELFSLSANETRALLQEVPRAYQTQINDVLLTALAQALQQWSGQPAHWIDLEGHGREELFDDLDLSRTVGWFTSLYPVRLDLTAATDAGSALKGIKERLRAIPLRGLGYGMARYLRQGDERVRALRAQEQPQISFNYLGQFDQAFSEQGLFSAASESSGWSVSPRGKREHLIEVNGSISGGQLHLLWSYSQNIHTQEQIQELVQAYGQALRALIAHCQLPGVGGYTPSDFPLTRVSQQQLDAVVGQQRNIEALYPLSPLQQGLLFQSLYAPGEGDYITQVRLTIEGQLNFELFTHAWSQIIQRHSIFRTAFAWEGVDESLQIVFSQVKLPFDLQDWRAYSSIDQAEYLSNYMRDDRTRGFDLNEAPLLRLTLIQLEQERYELLWTHHHLLLDGWSLPIVLKEVFACYTSLVEGKPLHWEPTRPYQNYIAWVQQQDTDKAEAFWRHWLDGFIAPTTFGIDRLTDRTEPGALPQRYGEVQQTLSLQTSQSLQDFVRKHHLTLNTVLLGAWSLILMRYSGQDDVVFGTTVAGRPLEVAGIEQMVGLFINTLPMRVRVRTQESLLLWLQSLQEQQSELRQYEYSPLAQIQNWSQIPRGTALFESLFVFENYPLGGSQQAAGKNTLNVTAMQAAEQIHYPLTLMILPQQRLGLKLLYDRTRFAATDMTRLFEHLQLVLEWMLTAFDQPVSTLELLTKQERTLVLETFNTTRVVYEPDLCMHQLLHAQVQRTPDAIALVAGQQQMSYAELDRRSNQLAQHLQQLGVGPDVLVGVCVERSVEMLVALVGVLKAGGAYVPLDPAYPSERLAYQVTAAQVHLLLTQASLLETLDALPVKCLCLDRDWQYIARQEEVAPPVLVAPEHLAYVIYTSGSTGRPKGVAIAHASVVNLLRWACELFSHEVTQRVLASTSICFDLSIFELFVPLSQGGTVVLVENALALSTQASEQSITLINTVPSAIGELLRAGQIPASVQTINLAGEALGRGLVTQLYQQTAVEQIYNLYGPSEDTTYSTVALLKREIEGSVSIGRPRANTRAYVLDKHWQLALVGVIGELYLAGAGLARGYLGQADLTAERFVPDSFSASGGGRLYRTGDLVRYRSDGQLEYVGRADQQVKVRGFRIELGEIESALEQQEQVREAVVLAREDTPGSKRLVAYLIPNAAKKFSWEGVQARLQERLPDYMVPSLHMVLEHFPLTPNGKIDRRALPVPDYAHLADAQSYEAPRNEIEQQLVEIWQQVLGSEHIGIHDNFFALGGDSILSIQVVSRARQAGIYMTPRQLFQHPAIADIVSVLETGIVVEAEQSLVKGDVPLTPIQHWFFEQEQPEPQHWNQSMFLTTPPDLNEKLLEETIAILIRQHDALRLHFHQTSSGWQQIHALESASEKLLGRFDLSMVSASEQPQVLEKLAGYLQASLKLASGPLMRVVYFDLGQKQPGRLLMIVHHLLIDGVSWRILLEDLPIIYRQLSQGVEVQLPAKTSSWQQWGRRLQHYAQSAELASQFGYWQQVLLSSTESLPLDQRDGVNSVASAQNVVISLSEVETIALLQKVPQAYHTQINDILLAALAQTLQQWTGASKHLIDLEGHGREELFADIDLSRTVGWFTSLYPVQLDTDGHTGPGMVLKAIKEQLRAIPMHGIGYGLLRYLRHDDEAIEPLKKLAQPQISFNYLGQFDQHNAATELFTPAPNAGGMVVSPLGHREHLLDINGSVSGGQLHLVWTYSQNVHHQETIASIAQIYLKTLQALIEHCLSPEAGGYTPSDFSLTRLTQEQLDILVEREDELEDIYPLSPLQQGLLFESLYAPGEGKYITQVRLTLQGQLDVSALRAAWQQTLQRHTILRTAFVWDGLEDALQLVCKDITLSFDERDWRSYSADEQEKRVQDYLRTDRVQGFELTQPPLMRFALLRLAPQSYEFIWTHHHLLLDGWSLPIVLKEAFESYEATTKGRTFSLRESSPYKNYIAYLVQQDMQEAEAFWRRTLKGYTRPTVLDIARIDSDKSMVDSKQGAYFLQLSRDVSRALQELARQQQLTINTLLLGAWGLLLSRYSGQDDVVFGTTVSGRPAEVSHIETMVGLFINTLPVRLKIPANMSLLAWLQALQEQQSELRQYEYSPLTQVQGWSEIARGSTLFESLFVFENYPIENSSIASNVQEDASNLHVQAINVMEQSNHPLMLVGMPGQQLSLRLTYDRSRFGDAMIEQLMLHLQSILTNIVPHLTQTLVHVPMLLPAEQQQLVTEWNQVTSSFPARGCLHELFEQRQKQTPDAIALTFEEQQLSYYELQRRSNQLAHHLRKLGVGTDVLVGLCVERSPDMLIGILGILKAGGAYVPLDPNYPRERLTFLMQDAQIKVLLTQQELLAQLPAYMGHTVCLDRERSLLAQEPETVPLMQADPESLAYVIYTSGSTGQPKGVQVSHANVVRLFESMPAEMHFGPDDSWTLFHSFAFDFSIWEMWGALLYGGRLVVVPFWISRSPEHFHLLLRESAVTILSQTPSAFRQLQAYEETLDSVTEQSDWFRLRYVVFGGEALDLADLRAWVQRHGDLQPQLINMYGITETTVHVTTRRIVRADIEAAQGSVIGTSLADLKLYVLDQQYQPVPVGVTGELYVGGAGVARGYLNRAELTAEHFVPDLYGQSGERLYKTGDLAWYTKTGDLEYRGRADEQVKIRGFRIELGEIEHVLEQHPLVRECIVVINKDIPETKRLIAYVVPVDMNVAANLLTEWRPYMLQQLPDYMVPVTVVVLDALPLTTNGKVDRGALPAPEQRRAEDNDHPLPRTEIEQQLALIWQHVLGVQHVGLDENFFTLGGDSILSIQVVSRARQKGIHLTPRLLFQHPTIGELVHIVGTIVTVEAEQGLVEGEVALTPIQHWFFEQEQPAMQHWNQAMLLSCPPSLDLEALKLAVADIVDHHDALRLRFVRVGQEWRQTNTGATTEIPLLSLDIAGVALAERANFIAARADEAQTSLDLEHGPLVRVVYMSSGAHEQGRLLIVIHHLAVDGVSWRILLEDLQSAYEYRSRREVSKLPPKTTSYQQWARQLQVYAQTDNLRQELGYWLGQVDREDIVLPRDYTKGENSIASAHSLNMLLSVDETQALLHEVPQAYHTQINDVLLTALALTLTKWSGRRAVTVNLEGHGREEVVAGMDLSRTVGWFTSIYPVHLELEDTTHPIDVLKAIKEQLRRVPHQGIGYGLLRYLNGALQDFDQLRSALDAEVSFNYLGQFDQVLNAESMLVPAAESSGSAVDAQGHRAHLLEINGSIYGGQLQLIWTYSRNVHNLETITLLVQNYQSALQDLIALCRTLETGGYTPSDFPDAALDQKNLDKLMNKLSSKKKKRK